MIEEGNIIEGNWELNVSGMSGTGKRVLATGSAAVKAKKISHIRDWTAYSISDLELTHGLPKRP